MHDSKITEVLQSEKQSFEDFIMFVATQHPFMAPVTGDLNPGDDIPEEFTPDADLADKATSTESLIKERLAFTEEEKTQDYEVTRDLLVSENESEIGRYAAIRGRAAEMLKSVVNWNPPTERHAQLQRSAIHELSDLEEAYSNTASFTSNIDAIRNVGPQHYSDMTIRDLRKQMGNESARSSAERENATTRTQFMGDLKDSLPENGGK
jgi:hypothetical protein